MKVKTEIENMEIENNNVIQTSGKKKKSKKSKKSERNGGTDSDELLNLKRKSEESSNEEEPTPKKSKNKNKNVEGNEVTDKENTENGNLSVEISSPKKHKKSKKDKKANFNEVQDESQENNQSTEKRKLDETTEEEHLSKKEKKRRKKQGENIENNNNSKIKENFTINGVTIVASIFGKSASFQILYEDNDYMTKYKNLHIRNDSIQELKGLRKSLKAEGLSKNEVKEKLTQEENLRHSEMVIDLEKSLLSEIESSNREDCLVPQLKKHIKNLESKLSSCKETNGGPAEDEAEAESPKKKDKKKKKKELEQSESEDEEVKMAKEEEENIPEFNNSFGPKTCNVCGSEDHLRRDCPNNNQSQSSFGDDSACFNCNEKGHFSRECPKKGGNRGRGGRSNSSVSNKDNAGCFNCHDPDHGSWACENECKFCRNNTDGHMRKDCPMSSSSADSVCYSCNEKGHFSRDCPKKGGGRGRGGRFNSSFSNKDSTGCRNCYEPDHTSKTCENECKLCRNNTDGHMRKDCPTADQCRNCGGKHLSWLCEEECRKCRDNHDGHARKDCTQSSACFNCNQSGHMSRDCPSSQQGGRGGFGGRGGRGNSRGGGFGSGSACFTCNEVGHMSRDCPKKGFGGRGRGGDGVNFMPIGRKGGFGRNSLESGAPQNKITTFDD